MTETHKQPTPPPPKRHGSGVFSFWKRRYAGPLLLFDYDGVIADSFSAYFQAFTEICAEMGFDRINSRESFLKLFDGNLVAQLIRAGFPITRLHRLANQFAPRIEAVSSRVQPFPGMPEMMCSLARQYTLYVITSNHTDTVKSFLERHQVTGVRDVIGADIEHSKVKKIKMVRRREPQLRPWYIGDTLGDMLEGRRAGARCVAAAWGWHGEARLLRGRPFLVAHSPDDLHTITWEE